MSDDTNAADLSDLASLSAPRAGDEAPAVNEAGELTDAAIAPAEAATEEAPAAAEPEKPKDEKSPPKLYTEALKLKDQAHQQIAEAKKIAADAEKRAHDLARREEDILKRESETKAKDAELAAVIKSDPIAAFERLGFTPHDLARWCMEDDGQRGQRLEKDERTQAQKELDERLAKLEEREKRIEHERIAQNQTQAQRGFVAFVDANHDAYPDIADEEPDDLMAIMWEVATATHEATGKAPTFEEIAKHLQDASASKRARRDERRSKRAKPQAPASSSEQTPRENGQPATSPGPRTAPKTLSNAASTELASGPRELSQEEIDRESLLELKRMWGGTAV